MIALFTAVICRVTVYYYYYVTYAQEAIVKRYSGNNAFLQISQNSQGNTCSRVSFLKKWIWHSCFPVSFAKFLRIPFLTEHLRWLLLAFQIESTLSSFKTSCSKQEQYLKFKRTITSRKYSHSNIIQTSSLCYVAGFQTPSISP